MCKTHCISASSSISAALVVKPERQCERYRNFAALVLPGDVISSHGALQTAANRQKKKIEPISFSATAGVCVFFGRRLATKTEERV